MSDGPQLAHVLWLGGMPGVGKTTAARRIAHRHDLRLYSIDSYTYAHAARLDPPETPFSELVGHSSPEELTDAFEAGARRRWELVLADLRELPDDAPVLVEGPHVLPELVTPFLDDRERAVFVRAEPTLQREIIGGRGSAHPKRLERDAILAARLEESARRSGLAVVEIGAVTETEPVAEKRFAPFLAEWIASDDHGDVAARRRDENDARLFQWRSHAAVVPAAADGRIGLACECDRPGCGELVEVDLLEAEARRARGDQLLAH